MSGLGPVRALLGTLDLLSPGLLSGRLLHTPLDGRTQRVARVLGARQVAQAIACAGEPTCAVLSLGVEVDAAHAASMLGLAVVTRRYRRAALLNAAIAAAFALAGVRAARSAPRQVERDSSLPALRDRLAGSLAKYLVPHYRRLAGQPQA